MRQSEPSGQELEGEQMDNYGCANEKAALVNGNQKKVTNECVEQGIIRKKNLSWKNEKFKDDQEDITAETSLLTDKQPRISVGLSVSFYCLQA